MKNKINPWQLLVVLSTVILLSLSALPTLYSQYDYNESWAHQLGFKPIKLGLDLYGGVLFVLNVDTQSARTELTQSMVDELTQYAKQHTMNGVYISTYNQNSVRIQLANDAAKSKHWPGLLAYIQVNFPELMLATSNIGSSVVQSPHLNPSKTAKHRHVYTLTWSPQQVNQYKQVLMQQSVDIMRKRIESIGITEASIQKQGTQHIRIELPGLNNPEHAKKIIGTTATLAVYAIASAQDPHFLIKDEFGQIHRLKKPAVFAGNNIKHAGAGTDQMGMPLVNLTLDETGGANMSQFSKFNVGKKMVTVFSEYKEGANGSSIKQSKIINTATLLSQLGNRFSITNLQSPQAAKELAVLIRAGSLNAPINIVEQRTISPSLGQENVKNSMAALVLGFCATMVFMALWYRGLGIIANLSLLVNLVCLLGLMALLPGMVLTLPGIAGIVLTVGMAVDTNVLVFERFKEQLKKSKHKARALNASYKKAFTTIIDANLTTMICGLILLSIGNGPVKGFAMTLCLGILTSLFSGVFVSRICSQIFVREKSYVQKEVK